jgi:hypothetical protein
MRKVRFVPGFELDEILMLTVSVVLIAALVYVIWVCRLVAVFRAGSGFVADFREITQLSSLLRAHILASSTRSS